MRAKEFIVETSEDDHQLVIYSKELAEQLYRRTKSSLLNFVKSTSAKGLSVRIPNNTPVEKVINSLKYEVFPGSEENVIGGFHPPSFSITLHPKFFINLPSEQAILRIQNSLMHEIRHAVDHVMSSGACTGNLIDITQAAQISGNYNDYFGHPMEVNARYSQAVLLISKSLPSRDLKGLILTTFNDNDLTAKFLGQKKFNHLVSRAYKFFSMYSENPPKVTQSWLDRAVKFIAGMI